MTTTYPEALRQFRAAARAALATREAEQLQARSKLTQQASLIAASQADVAASQATLDRS